MTVTDEQINRWANPPSETENEKCENAISQVTDALRSRFGNDITIVRQGSHRNRTNVRLDSDVDLAVVHNHYFFPDIQGLTPSDKALYQKYHSPASYTFSQFKADVHQILQTKFGAGAVDRKNKCIRVSGNSMRINADVVPAYEHRRFSSFGVVGSTGIEFVTDTGDRVHSFPDQHYNNGVKKNNDTKRAYKSVVRVLKNVRNHFVDEGKMKIEDMPSFFIESLVWNVPSTHFSGATWRDDAESVALKIWSDMREFEKSNNYAEVSDLMWLFRGQFHRSPKQAEEFMLKAWSFIKK